jgi:hypothetical protein
VSDRISSRFHAAQDPDEIATLTSPENKTAITRFPSATSLRRASNMALILSCVTFFLCGLTFIPYLGVQNDEALFAAPLYSPKLGFSSIIVSHLQIPLMQMSYLGCLKAWIYKPIFSLWAPSVFSLRVPVLVIGTATIWLSWLLLRLTLGDRAAIIGTILLATDSIFLLTTCFDWGPVALQHVLMVGGVVALVCFHRSGKDKLLALGFLLFGLGMWDKALFSWSLSGMAIATIVVYPRDLWKEVRWQRLLIAALFFVLGMFPLLWYNLVQGGRTFSGNARFSQRYLRIKIQALESTADGSALFGYLVSNDPPRDLRPAHTLVQRSSVALSHWIGNRPSNFMTYGFLLALVTAPFLWSTSARKPMLFSLVLLAVFWLQMALTIGAGTGAHHVILMWPWPIFLVAAAFSQVSLSISRYGTAMIGAVVLFLAASNLLVTNQYLERVIEDGPGPVWTDAIFPLAEYLRTRTSSEIYSVDWGTMNSLRLLNRGTLRLQEATFMLLKDKPTEEEKQFLLKMTRRNDGLLVAHTQAFEAFNGINTRLLAFAIREGYQPHAENTIDDREGRAVFEVFRFEKRAEGAKPGLPRHATKALKR